MAVGYLVEPLGYEHVAGFVEPEGLPIIIKFDVAKHRQCGSQDFCDFHFTSKSLQNGYNPAACRSQAIPTAASSAAATGVSC